MLITDTQIEKKVSKLGFVLAVYYCYKRDSVFYNKVNRLVKTVVDTLEKKHENN